MVTMQEYGVVVNIDELCFSPCISMSVAVIDFLA